MYYIIYIIIYITSHYNEMIKQDFAVLSFAHSIALSSDSIATRRDAATPYFWRR